MSDSEWWAKRATQYDNLEWTTSDHFLWDCWEFADIKPGDHVWDIGCGTGTFEMFATALEPKIYMLGTDKSKEMVQEANGKLRQLASLYREPERGTITFAQHDIDSIFQPPELFNRDFEVVYMRNVMHHVDNKLHAMTEIFDHIRPGGHFVLISAIPPSRAIKDWYEEVFRIKDGRTVLWPHDIIDLFKTAGFNNIEQKEFIMSRMSVTNWLNNNALSWWQKRKILKMHKNLDSEGKKAYNMRKATRICRPDKTDLLIDIKFLMVKGYKPN